MTLTIINKGTAVSHLIVRIGSRSRHSKASLIRLGGPAIDAKSGITLGGAEVTSIVTWKPKPSEVLVGHGGQFGIELPAASAAIVQFA